MKCMLLPIMFAFCGCKAYYLQKSTIPPTLLPPDCQLLYDFVQTNWYKHKNNPCHRAVNDPMLLAGKYKLCLEKLSKSQMEALLGVPDKVEFNCTYIYFMKKDCRDMDNQDSNSLTITFKEDQVWRVESFRTARGGDE